MESAREKKHESSWIRMGLGAHEVEMINVWEPSNPWIALHGQNYGSYYNDDEDNDTWKQWHICVKLISLLFNFAESYPCETKSRVTC